MTVVYQPGKVTFFLKFITLTMKNITSYRGECPNAATILEKKTNSFMDKKITLEVIRIRSF